jgi:hypothetical protein
MLLAATVDPSETTKDEAHTSGRWATDTSGLESVEILFSVPNSIRRPAKKSPTKMVTSTGKANCRLLMRRSIIND